MLVAEGRLDEGWESIILETLQNADDHHWQNCKKCRALVKRALSVLGSLANALVKQNKISAAVKISWQSRLLHEKYYTDAQDNDGDQSGSNDDTDTEDNSPIDEREDVGESDANISEAQQTGSKNRKAKSNGRGLEHNSKDPRIWEAMKNYASILSLGTDPQVREALNIQKELLGDGTFADMDEETLSLLTDMAAARSRIGRHEEALEGMSQVLDVTQATFGDVHLASLGCMADLAGSLSLHGRGALETPVMIRRELLNIAQEFSNEQHLQLEAISLLWTLSRPGFLDEGISKIRQLAEYFESQYPGQLRVIVKLKSWLVLDLRFMFETGGVDPHGIGRLLEQLSVVKFVETCAPED